MYNTLYIIYVLYNITCFMLDDITYIVATCFII